MCPKINTKNIFPTCHQISKTSFLVFIDKKFQIKNSCSGSEPQLCKKKLSALKREEVKLPNNSR